MAEALEAIPQRKKKRKMLVLYLKERTGLGKQKIEIVLEAIEEFKKEMVKEVQR